MATIYVDNLINNNSPEIILSTKSKSSKDYVYSDLHLDFELKTTLEDGSYNIKTNDIKVDYDELAIKNSLFNIFNTRKGMRYLNPEFGASFEQFLFEKISIINARVLAQIVRDHLVSYEDRINVLKVFAQSFPEEYMYQVDIAYKILINGKYNQLKANFTENGVTLV